MNTVYIKLKNITFQDLIVLQYVLFVYSCNIITKEMSNGNEDRDKKVHTVKGYVVNLIN